MPAHSTRPNQSLFALLVLGAAACSKNDNGTGLPPAVASVAVTLSASTVNTGGTVQGTAVLRDASNNVLTGRTVTWSTSNIALATAAPAGVITAVAAGTVQVTATSEGKSGSASLTITAPPVVNVEASIGSLTANGVAINAAHVAGSFTAAIGVTWLPGFIGQLVVMLGNVEKARIAIPLPAGTVKQLGNTAMVTGTALVDVTSTTVSTTFDGNTIAALPLNRNGLTTLAALVPGAVGQPNQSFASRDITLDNPDFVIGVGEVTGNSATGNGQTWYAGDIKVHMVPVSYDPVLQSIQEFSVVAGPASALYGRSNGTINIVTKSGTNNVPGSVSTVMNKSELPGFSASIGSSIWLESRRINTVLVDPQITATVRNGVTFDGNGDGFADVDAPPPGATFLPGVTRVILQPDITLQLPTDRKWLNLSRRFFYDHQGVTVGANAFNFRDRNTTLYQPVKDAFGSACCRDNWIPRNYNLNNFLDYSAVSDGGVGFNQSDPNATKIYVGTSATQAGLQLPANRWTLGTNLTLSFSRNSYIGAEFNDALGNNAFKFLPSSAGNPRTTGDVFGTPGVSNALVGIADFTSPLTPYVGLRDRAWFFQLNPAGTFGLNHSDAVPLAAPFGATVKRNNAYVLGLANTPWNVPTTQNGNVFTYSFTDVLSQIPGEKQGLYEVELFPFNAAGVPLASTQTGGRYVYRGHYDYTAPTLTSFIAPTTPFTAGQSLHFTGIANDNLHISKFRVGVNYGTFFATDFASGTVNATIAETPDVNPFDNALRPTDSQSIDTPMPWKIQLFDFAGNPQQPVYPLTDFLMSAVDGAGNVSNEIKVQVPPGSLPQGNGDIPADAKYTLTHNQNSVCTPRTAECGATPTTSTATATITTTNTADPFATFLVYALIGGRAHQVCRSSQIAKVVVGAFATYTIACEIQWGNYRGPGGAGSLFAWVLTAQRLALKSQFLALNVSLP